MVTCLLLSSKVPEERRAATRYGASMAQGPGGAELCGKGTREDGGLLEGEVKKCKAGEEHGIPAPSCSAASPAGQCSCRTNP